MFSVVFPLTISTLALLHLFKIYILSVITFAAAFPLILLRHVIYLHIFLALLFLLSVVVLRKGIVMMMHHGCPTVEYPEKHPDNDKGKKNLLPHVLLLTQVKIALRINIVEIFIREIIDKVDRLSR